VRNASKPTALKGWEGRAPIHLDEPQVGFYKVNVRVDGVGWVPLPARLEMVSGERDEAGDLIEDEVFEGHVAGKVYTVDEFWPHNARHPITEDEYNAICEGNERWTALRTGSGPK